jgi:hypothetical protein
MLVPSSALGGAARSPGVAAAAAGDRRPSTGGRYAWRQTVVHRLCLVGLHGSLGQGWTSEGGWECFLQNRGCCHLMISRLRQLLLWGHPPEPCLEQRATDMHVRPEYDSSNMYASSPPSPSPTHPPGCVGCLLASSGSRAPFPLPPNQHIQTPLWQQPPLPPNCLWLPIPPVPLLLNPAGTFPSPAPHPPPQPPSNPPGCEGCLLAPPPAAPAAAPLSG